jgi:type VI secretion system protein ImpF
MPPPQNEATVTLSVLDRLIDLAPDNTAEATLSPAESKRRLRVSVLENLEWILNTRCSVPDPEESLKKLPHSLYLYGLPDVSSYSMKSSEDRDRLRERLRSAITLFEPRLDILEIKDKKDAELGSQQQCFHIDAMLLLHSSRVPVSFDAFFELRNYACRVGEADAR